MYFMVSVNFEVHATLSLYCRVRDGLRLDFRDF